MKRYTAYLLIALLISALKNIEVPEQYDILFGIPGHHQTVNNFIYFLGMDLVLLFMMLTICCLNRTNKVFSIIAHGALWLAWGKVVDEFITPYGYHTYEFIYDVLIILITLINLFNLNKKI